MTAFPQIVLEAMRLKHEVEVETRSGTGAMHKVVIWIVVVDDVPYVRSVRGARGRWFRELLAQGGGAIHIGPRRVPVRATRVSDAESNARVSLAIEEKYHRPVASVKAMVRDEVLATTAHLEPADPRGHPSLRHRIDVG